MRTPYPDVVSRVRAVTRPPSASRYGRNRRRPRRARHARQSQPRVPLIAVTITGGERVTFSFGGYHVPRYDLLANLRVLLEKRMLEIAVTGSVADALRTELLRWGRRSTHDDLIFATALACWKAGGQPFSLHGLGPLPLVFPELRR